MAFYTIRSERQLMEQINYNLLFRCFVGFSMDDKVWSHSVFTKNRRWRIGMAWWLMPGSRRPRASGTGDSR